MDTPGILSSVDDVGLDCVHCGLCLESCPTYRVTGLEPSSPRGRIQLMRAFSREEIELRGPAARHLDDCLGCRACESACPAGVRYGEMFEITRSARLRRDPTATGVGRGPVAWALDALPHRRIGRMMATILRFYVRSGLRALLRASRLPERWSPRLVLLEGLVPEFRHPARRLDAIHVPATGSPRGTVALFRGCVAEDLFPDVTDDAALLLSAAGYEVHLPLGQTCCGALDQHAGREARAVELARRNLAALDGNFDAVVFTSAGCGAHLKTIDRHVDGEAARRLAARVRDVTELLADGIDAIALAPIEEVVTYDAPCHLLHAQRVAEAPLTLLRAIPEIDLRPLAGAELCCGSAGIHNLLHPELSAKVLDEKVAALRATGAHIVTTGNPGCLLQIAHGLREQGIEMEVMHPVTLLARAHRRALAALS